MLCFTIISRSPPPQKRRGGGRYLTGKITVIDVSILSFLVGNEWRLFLSSLPEVWSQPNAFKLYRKVKLRHVAD